MFERTISLAPMAAVVLWSSGAGVQDQKVYGVLLKTLSNPFWGAMGQGVEDGAAEPASSTTSRPSNPASPPGDWDRAKVLISHRLTDVFAVSDRIIALRRGQVIADEPTAQTSMNAVLAHIVGAG
jgi:hypothetical protein